MDQFLGVVKRRPNVIPDLTLDHKLLKRLDSAFAGMTKKSDL
jgi:hypothetical protein